MPCGRRLILVAARGSRQAGTCIALTKTAAPVTLKVQFHRKPYFGCGFFCLVVQTVSPHSTHEGCVAFYYVNLQERKPQAQRDWLDLL